MVSLICSLLAMPTISSAQARDTTKKQAREQRKEQAEDFVHDVLRALLGPNWNLFAHGGITSGNRFVLEQATSPIAGQRALKSATGWDLGAGGGVDVLLRLGFRASYTYASRNLNYRTDNGDGSEALNIDDVGTLKSNTVAIEIMRYMLPSDATITPYGTVGIQGTWWALHEKSPLVTSSGSSTPFSISPLFAFGMQVKPATSWSVRVEAILAGGHNPFTGNRSFRALAGPAIDEPTSVGRTDFRLAGVYYFGRPQKPTIPSAVTNK